MWLLCGCAMPLTAVTDSYPNSDYVPLVNLIGVHFQIRDDYMNLQSTQVRLISYSVCIVELLTQSDVCTLQYADNKGFAEDLTEGKFSFPVVHGVRADTSNRQILSMFSPSFITNVPHHIRQTCYKSVQTPQR